MKDKVSQEHVCEEEMPLNNNIGKQIGDIVEMPSEIVEQGMDDHVPDEIDGANFTFSTVFNHFRIHRNKVIDPLLLPFIQLLNLFKALALHLILFVQQRTSSFSSNHFHPTF
ncbi:hypothetical protein Tco_0405495 [Tanacetum coccineum]